MMNKNVSLPNIYNSPSKKKNNTIHFQTPQPDKQKQNQSTLSEFYSNGSDPLPKGNINSSKTRIDTQRSEQKRNVLSQSMSDSRLPEIQKQQRKEMSVQEMKLEFSKQDDKMNNIIKKSKDEVTTILLEDNQLIIQPKFFEKNGSMCMTELWSATLKKEFLNFSEQDVIVNSNGKKRFKVQRVAKNNRKGNQQEIEKLLANVYRPDKLKDQAEVNRILEDLKQGVQVTKQSIADQIKNYSNRTPLDIKVRMYHKKKTMVFDEDQEEEDNINNQKQTESDNSSLRQMPLPNLLGSKDDSQMQFKQFEIQEVDDERLESSPVHGNHPNYPSYDNDYIKECDNLEFKYNSGDSNNLTNNDKLNNNQISLKLSKNYSTNSQQSYQNYKIQNSQNKISPIKLSRRNVSMPKLMCKNDIKIKGLNINKETEKYNSQEKKKSDQSYSDKDIYSLNHISVNNIEDSFDYNEETLTDGYTTRSNQNNGNNNDTTLNDIYNSPEQSQYMNSIKNVIEQCNLTLEKNTVLQKQIKKHTYKLNNRNKNLSSTTNLEKRIQSSTIF